MSFNNEIKIVEYWNINRQTDVVTISSLLNARCKEGRRALFHTKIFASLQFFYIVCSHEYPYMFPALLKSCGCRERGGGGGTYQSLIWGISALRSNPLPFLYIPFCKKMYETF